MTHQHLDLKYLYSGELTRFMSFGESGLAWSCGRYGTPDIAGTAGARVAGDAL